jgi:hypothetical protein
MVVVLAFATVVSACHREPVGPSTDSAVTPLLAADGAEVSTFDLTFNLNSVWPFPCLNGGEGDDIRFQGPSHWRFKLVVTPSGNIHGVWRWLGGDITFTSDRNGDTYVVRGQRKAGVEVWHELNGKVGYIHHLNDLWTLVNERTGEVVQSDWHYHLMIFPDEVRVIDRFVETCK